jgi:hypothetical protein
MPFTPRLKEQIHQELLARVVARSKLTDAEPSSVINAILATVSEEFEAAEFAMMMVRDSYSFLDVSSTYLDERCAELPPRGITRLGSSSASGAVLELNRSDDAFAAGNALIVPAGSVFGRSGSSATYTLSASITFDAGQTKYPASGGTYASIVANTAGSAGNASIGEVDSIVSGPVGLISVTNVQLLTGGQDSESDASLRKRAILYLSSLARCQKSALEYFALSFQSSDGTRVRHAKVFEDPNLAGVVDLVIDDGSGLSGLTEPMSVVTGTIGTNLSPIAHHESPATTPISQIAFNFGEGSVVVKASDFTDGAPGWVSIPERGLVLFQHVFDDVPFTTSVAEAGTTWQIGGSSGDVYTGVIKELQTAVEGDPSDPVNSPGLRAAGIRVRVVPPLVDTIDMEFSVVAAPGTNLEVLVEALKISIVEFCRELGPGQTLYLGLLTAFLVSSFPEDLLSVHFTDPSTDRAPSTPRHVIRADASKIVVKS